MMPGAWSLEGWYYRRTDALLGPVSTGELKQLVAYGHLSPLDTVWAGWNRHHERILIPTIVRAALERVPADAPNRKAA